MRIPADGPTGPAQMHVHCVGRLEADMHLTVTLVGLESGPQIIGSSGASDTFTIDEVLDVFVDVGDLNNLIQLRLDLTGTNIGSTQNSISDTLVLFRI
jgi:hypothetical protein